VRILVLNAGSSSLKFQLIDTDGAAIAESRDRRLARGVVERIGGQAIVTLQGSDGRATKSTAPIRDHAAAVEHVIAWLTSSDSGVEIESVGQIEAVGHRVVHGGEQFTHSTRIDETVRRELEDLIYGWNEEVESNAVEFLIHTLRKKLGATAIRNVRGVGWMVARRN